MMIIPHRCFYVAEFIWVVAGGASAGAAAAHPTRRSAPLRCRPAFRHPMANPAPLEKLYATLWCDWGCLLLPERRRRCVGAQHACAPAASSAGAAAPRRANEGGAVDKCAQPRSLCSSSASLFPPGSPNQTYVDSAVSSQTSNTQTTHTSTLLDTHTHPPQTEVSVRST